jgi:uncharacterized membrane protein YqaE (UPF0057 family)
MLDIVLSPINKIVGPITSLVNAIVTLVMFIFEAMKLVTKIIDILAYLINIPKLLSDLLYGLTTGVMMVLTAFFDILFGDIRKNMMGQTLSENDNEGNSSNSYEEEETMKLNKNIVEIIILILCPPLAIFFKNGLNIKTFFLVIIASILTYFYYIPGLIYGSLFIL